MQCEKFSLSKRAHMGIRMSMEGFLEEVALNYSWKDEKETALPCGKEQGAREKWLR